MGRATMGKSFVKVCVSVCVLMMGQWERREAIMGSVKCV